MKWPVAAPLLAAVVVPAAALAAPSAADQYTERPPSATGDNDPGDKTTLAATATRGTTDDSGNTDGASVGLSNSSGSGDSGTNGDGKSTGGDSDDKDSPASDRADGASGDASTVDSDTNPVGGEESDSLQTAGSGGGIGLALPLIIGLVLLIAAGCAWYAKRRNESSPAS